MSAAAGLRQEVTFMVRDGSGGLDRAVVFDDERVVANAGVVLRGGARGRLGIEALVDATVVLGGRRAGRRNPGRKVMTLVSRDGARRGLHR